MIALGSVGLLATLVLVPTVVSVDEVPNPRASHAWVTDAAGVLDRGGEDALDRRLAKIAADLGAEVAMVTVPEVAGDARAFAVALFRRWGVGHAERDDGVLIVMVTERRRVEIVTGYGFDGVLSKAWLDEMQATHMVPRFRAQDFAGAFLAAADAIGERLETKAGRTATREGTTLPWALVLAIVALAIGLGAMALQRHGRADRLSRRRRSRLDPRDPRLGDPNPLYAAMSVHAIHSGTSTISSFDPSSASSSFGSGGSSFSGGDTGGGGSGSSF